MRLTQHFTLEEMTASDVAKEFKIKNEPNARQISNLVHLCANTLEEIRFKLKKPINVTSGYRCIALNSHPKIEGAKTSQHIAGEAADINVKGMTTQELFDFIVDNNIPFDQIIQEFDRWVHISFRTGRNRRSMLYAYKNSKGRTVYSRYPEKALKAWKAV